MTEQFMENISNEEHERLLLLCGHGIGPSLSPAAQSIWQQYCGIVEEHGPARLGLAAALRAAADQVVPEFWHEDDDIYGETMQDIRKKLFTIADELGGIND